MYRNNINDNFVAELRNSYNADFIIDEFENPDKINDWVNEKTYEMIPNILDKISPDFVLGLANALAIDVEWNSPFDCSSTSSEKFSNGKKTYKVEMMHNTYDTNAKYFETNNAKGIILPYAKDNTTQLEFVSILPKNNLKTYIDNLVKTA